MSCMSCRLAIGGCVWTSGSGIQRSPGGRYRARRPLGAWCALWSSITPYTCEEQPEGRSGAAACSPPALAGEDSQQSPKFCGDVAAWPGTGGLPRRPRTHPPERRSPHLGSRPSAPRGASPEASFLLLRACLSLGPRVSGFCPLAANWPTPGALRCSDLTKP